MGYLTPLKYYTLHKPFAITVGQRIMYVVSSWAQSLMIIIQVKYYKYGTYTLLMVTT